MTSSRWRPSSATHPVGFCLSWPLEHHAHRATDAVVRKHALLQYVPANQDKMGLHRRCSDDRYGVKDKQFASLGVLVVEYEGAGLRHKRDVVCCPRVYGPQVSREDAGPIFAAGRGRCKCPRPLYPPTPMSDGLHAVPAKVARGIYVDFKKRSGDREMIAASVLRVELNRHSTECNTV